MAVYSSGTQVIASMVRAEKIRRLLMKRTRLTALSTGTSDSTLRGPSTAFAFKQAYSVVARHSSGAVPVLLLVVGVPGWFTVLSGQGNVAQGAKPCRSSIAQTLSATDKEVKIVRRCPSEATNIYYSNNSEECCGVVWQFFL